MLPGVVAAAWALVMWYITDDAPTPDSKVRVRDLNGVDRVVSAGVVDDILSVVATLWQA